MNSILVELFNEVLKLMVQVLLSLGIIIFLVRSYVFMKTHIDGGNRNSFSIAQECFDGKGEVKSLLMAQNTLKYSRFSLNFCYITYSCIYLLGKPKFCNILDNIIGGVVNAW
ncbi:MAG: hypothetical protein QXF61_01105 [Nitrososphaeria archaeon]